MAASTLGTKFICFMCQAKFYDLNRPDPLCPRCGANQKDQPKPKATPSRSRAAERARPVEVYPVAAEEPEIEEELPEPPSAAALDEEPSGDEEDEA